jgi:OmpA-OmpF porin, OOP family
VSLLPNFRAPLLLLALVMALLSSSSPVRAQTSLDQPFPEGFALSPVEPAPAGDRWFTVTDGSVLREADKPDLRAMLFGHFAYQPVLIRTDAMTGERRELVSRQLYVHGDVSYAATDWLLLNLDVPFAALQEGEGTGSAVPGSALGDIRIGARAAVVGGPRDAFAFGPEVFLWVPSGSEDDLTGDGALRGEPRLAVSGRAGVFAYAANAGVLIRKHLNVGSLEVGTSFSFGAAAGVILFDDVLQVGPEIYGRSLLSSDANRSFGETAPVGALLGARARFGDVVFGAGFGPGITEAPGSAPRAYFSLAFAPESKVQVSASLTAEARGDGDGDGVTDTEDACPDRAGVSSNDPKLNGCPPPEKQGDRDEDGIPDDIDMCPDEAGVPSKDSSKYGCPAPPPPPDGDGDGISDSDDACPNEAGVASETKEKNGCPAEAPVAPPTAVTEKLGPPAAASEPKKGERAVVTMAGFNMHDNGTSRLYVDVTRPVSIDVTQKGTRLEYTLENTRITLKNNKNPLLAQYFGSVVVSARLTQDKRDAKLVIVMRAPLKPVHRLVEQPGGSASLVIDFPATPDVAPAPPPASPGTPQPAE